MDMQVDSEYRDAQKTRNETAYGLLRACRENAPAHILLIKCVELAHWDEAVQGYADNLHLYYR